MTNRHWWLPYTILAIPFLAGIGTIVYLEAPRDWATNPEGAFLETWFLGRAASIALVPIIFWFAIAALRDCRVPFPVFLAGVAVALAPVAYLQCVGVTTSMLLDWMSSGSEAFAIFYGATTLVTYAIYRLVPSAACD